MSRKLPTKKYTVIYADPPWHYKTYSEKGRKKCPDWRPFEGSPALHYKTMSLDKIKKLAVGSVAADDCVLLMWATMPMLPEALKVIEAWGFKFKTVGFTWMKQNRNTPTFFIDAKDIFMGAGYWTRSNAELCLLATRGKPKRKSASVRQAIFSPVREHSRKPTEVYGRIEELMDGPYIELFSRTRRKGWDAWGNQTEKFTGRI